MGESKRRGPWQDRAEHTLASMRKGFAVTPAHYPDKEAAFSAAKRGLRWAAHGDRVAAGTRPPGHILEKLQGARQMMTAGRHRKMAGEL